MSPQTRPDTFTPIDAHPVEPGATAATAFPPPAPATVWPPSAPTRRHRRWPWVAGGIAALILTIGGVVVVNQTLLTHDLLSEDFTDGPGAFLEGSTDEYTMNVDGGAYEITSNMDEPGRVGSYAWFARTAYSVEVRADVTELSDPEGYVMVGVSCLDEPLDNQHGYSFMIGPDGYALVRWDGEQDGRTLTRRTPPST